MINIGHLWGEVYGIRSSNISEIPSISNEKPGISIETPSISIEKLGISNQKFWNTRFFTPWRWNTGYFLVFRKRCEISDFWWIRCTFPSIGFRSYLRLRRLLSKYCTPAQLDPQLKHSTPFFDSFTNPTGESGELT